MLQRTRLGPGVCVRHFRSSPVKVNTVKWMSFPRVSVFPESICRAVLCRDIGAAALGISVYMLVEVVVLVVLVVLVIGSIG